jgi:threonine/homoserine/homoserine lactone efflux protein
MGDPGKDSQLARKGRQVALFLAAVGLYWIGITWLGARLEWTNRSRAFFDLIALAGFGWALWAIFQIWRQRRED